MVERIRQISIGTCTLEEFLSERLKKYIKDMTTLESSNLYDTVIGEVERALIKIVLEATEGNQVRAAKTLGISRNTLRDKMKQYKIGNLTGHNERTKRGRRH